jgi:hypothetical protein
MSPICNQILVISNQLVCLVVVEDDSINDEASTLKTLSTEYNRTLQITPVCSSKPAQNERKIK